MRFVLCGLLAVMLGGAIPAHAQGFAGLPLTAQTVQTLVRSDWQDLTRWADCSETIPHVPSATAKPIADTAQTCLQLDFAPKAVPGRPGAVILTRLFVTEDVCLAPEAEACYRGYAMPRITQSLVTGQADLQAVQLRIDTRSYWGIARPRNTAIAPPDGLVPVARDAETAPIRGIRFGRNPGALILDTQQIVTLSVPFETGATRWTMTDPAGQVLRSGVVPRLPANTSPCLQRGKEAALAAQQAALIAGPDLRDRPAVQGAGGAAGPKPANPPSPMVAVIAARSVHSLCRAVAETGQAAELNTRSVLTGPERP